jgi:hypothetical protein
MSVIVLPQTRAANGGSLPGVSSPAPKIPVPPYDRELPPAYWQNLKAAKASPPAAAANRSKAWIAGFAAFVLVAGALAWVTARSTRLNESGYALPPMGEPNIQPSPPRALAPVLQPPIRVERAALVTRRIVKRALPVRRVGDPPIGSSFDAQMPYGETVHCTFMGRVKSQANLPLQGGFIGETVAIGDQEFVWAAPAGGVAQWIDP